MRDKRVTSDDVQPSIARLKPAQILSSASYFEVSRQRVKDTSIKTCRRGWGWFTSPETRHELKTMILAAVLFALAGSFAFIGYFASKWLSAADLRTEVEAEYLIGRYRDKQDAHKAFVTGFPTCLSHAERIAKYNVYIDLAKDLNHPYREPDTFSLYDDRGPKQITIDSNARMRAHLSRDIGYVALCEGVTTRFGTIDDDATSRWLERRQQADLAGRDPAEESRAERSDTALGKARVRNDLPLELYHTAMRKLPLPTPEELARTKANPSGAAATRARLTIEAINAARGQARANLELGTQVVVDHLKFIEQIKHAGHARDLDALRRSGSDSLKVTLNLIDAHQRSCGAMLELAPDDNHRCVVCSDRSHHERLRAGWFGGHESRERRYAAVLLQRKAADDYVEALGDLADFYYLLATHLMGQELRVSPMS